MRLPWHDIALQVQGEAVIDMVRHFIQYWNYVTVDTQQKNKQNNLMNIQIPEETVRQQDQQTSNPSLIDKIRTKIENKIRKQPQSPQQLRTDLLASDPIEEDGQPNKDHFIRKADQDQEYLRTLENTNS